MSLGKFSKLVMGSVAMLAAKRSAGVAPQGECEESII